MKFSISLLQLIGILLAYATLGYLSPLFIISLNPFQAAPLWIVISAILVLILDFILALVGGRWTPKFKPTHLQWVGVGLLSFVIYTAAYLLTTHATQWHGIFPMAIVIIVVFGMQLRSNRSPKSE
jgi:hypothetical protein